MITLTCPRCNGSGNYSYHMVHGTVCFKCDGAGVIEITEAQYRAMQKRQAKAAELKEIKEEERKAKQVISEYVISTLIARYQDNAKYQKMIAHNPDSYPLCMESALRMFYLETGKRYRNWIGELAEYL